MSRPWRSTGEEIGEPSVSRPVEAYTEAGSVIRFAEVTVDAPAGYNRTFSYSIPHDSSPTLHDPIWCRILQCVLTT